MIMIIMIIYYYWVYGDNELHYVFYLQNYVMYVCN